MAVVSSFQVFPPGWEGIQTQSASALYVHTDGGQGEGVLDTGFLFRVFSKMTNLKELCVIGG